MAFAQERGRPCVHRYDSPSPFIWMAAMPVPRILSASFEVCWSPSITMIGNLCFKSAIARTSSEVLPEPGLETKLSAKMPAAFSRALLARAKASSWRGCRAPSG